MATKSIYKVDKQKYTPSKGETFPFQKDEKYKVVQGEAFSVREMLIKHANGTMFDNVKTPFYEEQATFSTMELNKIQSMDAVDKLIYLKEIKEKASALETQISDYKSQQEALEVELIEDGLDNTVTGATTEPPITE